MAIQIPDPNNPGQFLEYTGPDFSGMNFDPNAGIFDLLRFNPETMQMEMKYESVLTPEEKAAKSGMVGTLYDPVTGEMAPEETQYALMDLASQLGSAPVFVKGQNKPSFMEVDGEIVPTDRTITLEQFQAATEGLSGAEYLDAVNKLPPVGGLSYQEQRDLQKEQGLAVVKRQKDIDAASKLRKFKNIGRAIDIVTGGSGLGTAGATLLGGGDLGDAASEAFKTAGVYAAGQNLLSSAYDAANPFAADISTAQTLPGVDPSSITKIGPPTEGAQLVAEEQARQAAATSIAQTAAENMKGGVESLVGSIPGIDTAITGGKLSAGIESLKKIGEEVKEFVDPVTEFVEKEVKGVGEVLGIDKEKRDEIREFFGDTEDKAKEEIKETIDEARDKIIEGGGAAADAASGINFGGILAGGAGALLLDQLLNQQPAPDNYAQFREQYEAQKPKLTGFAPVGTAIPRVGLPVQGFANGGLNDLAPFQAYGQISGPGTGTSDSIPAYLSDGEFVMTAKAVKGLGNGDKNKGAAKMYAMMDKFESMA